MKTKNAKNCVRGALTSIMMLPVMFLFQNCADQKMAFSERVPEYSAITDGTCSQEGVTQATIKTSSVINGRVDSYFEYEVAHSDCDGFALVLEKADILFDIDGFVTGVTPIRYEIDDGITKYDGRLNTIAGKDLFGKTGSNLFHFATLNVNLNAETKKVTLRIFLDGQSFKKTDGSTPVGDELLNTYLRFGNAKPVMKVVKFVNK